MLWNQLHSQTLCLPQQCIAGTWRHCPGSGWPQPRSSGWLAGLRQSGSEHKLELAFFTTGSYKNACKGNFTNLRKWGRHYTEVKFALFTQLPWASLSTFPYIFTHDIDVADISQRRWLEESGHRFDNLDRTHLVRPSTTKKLCLFGPRISSLQVISNQLVLNLA